MSRKSAENRRRGKPRSQWHLVRPLITGSVVLLAAVLVFTLSVCLSWAYGALLQADIFRLDRVRIEGIERLDRNRVLDALGVSKGTNMLNLRMQELQNRLTGLPWVGTAQVRLDLPAELNVTLRERHPVARLAGRIPLLVDSNGELFKPADREPVSELPRLLGFEDQRLKPGDRLPVGIASEIGQLLVQFQSSRGPLAPESISTIEWTRGKGLSCNALDGKLEIVFGTGRYPVKLDRFQRILELLARNGEMDAVQSIDLDYEHRAFLTWRGAGRSGL